VNGEDTSSARAADAPSPNQKKAPRILVLDPVNPMASARRFVEAKLTREGQRLLHRHRGGFYRWDGACYRLLTDEAVNGMVWCFLEKALKSRTEPFKPRNYHVVNVVAALKAAAALEDRVEAPAWLDDVEHPPADELFACANGLLHLPTGKMLSATPAFFNVCASRVTYDPKAPEPSRWLEFLREVWAKDSEAIEALQEWFGYLLSADTSQQKILLMIGPRRSGKGTIARVCRELVGRESFVGPTMRTFGERFGLQSLIHATAAFIADARIGRRTETTVITERLLAISGEDTFTTDRKNRDAWTGKFPTRIAIFANSAPAFADDSNALVGRYIILVMTESFYGREDPKLTRKLVAELPGILNWAIEGYRRLNERGHFVQPQSAMETYAHIEALSAPVKAFIEEEYEVAPGRTVTVQGAWEDWQVWCLKRGRDPGNDISFGLNLKTAVPGIARRRGGTREMRLYVYEGIGRKIDHPKE
jgi:putative DNA primase/helicase